MAIGGGGRRLGEYELVRELGRGGMGVVYAARHPRLGDVALKLTLGHALDAEGLARLRREVAALRRLDHPNVVPVRDAGQHDGHCYVAMAMVRGESLHARLARGPLPAREAAAAALGLARAVAHLHVAGVLHRDLKPHNVLLTPDGRAVLVDFGLARVAFDSQRLTATGEALGTPAYMAPEQALGLGRPGPAIDVYGLGATLYEMLCGRPPYDAPSPLQTLTQVAQGPPPPPSRVREGVDPGLERLCLACMDRDPARRLEAEDVVEALEAWRPAAPVRRRPRALLAAAAGAVVAAAGAAGWVIMAAAPAAPMAPPELEAPSPPPPPAPTTAPTPAPTLAEAAAPTTPGAEQQLAPPLELLRRAVVLATQGRARAREALALADEAVRREPTARVLLAGAVVQRWAARAGAEEPPEALLDAAEARLAAAARAGAPPDLVLLLGERLVRDREEVAAYQRLRDGALTADARLDLARRCRQLGRREEALERLAALTDEFGATAEFHRAGELFLMARLDEARAVYGRVLAGARGPSVLYCHLRLAQVCSAQGDWAAALAHVDGGLAAATDRADVGRLFLEQARALAGAGRPADALEPADLALELLVEAGAPHAETALPMALVAEGFRATGQEGAARAACEQAFVLARELLLGDYPVVLATVHEVVRRAFADDPALVELADGAFP